MTLPEQVGSLRIAIRRVMTRRMRGRTQRPFNQLLAIKVIARGEALNQTALAERLLIDAPAASRLVARLEADGLIRRSEGADRRCVNLEVTRAAQKDLATFEEAIANVDHHLRKRLSARECADAMQLMAKMVAALEEVERGEED